MFTFAHCDNVTFDISNRKQTRFVFHLFQYYTIISWDINMIHLPYSSGLLKIYCRRSNRGDAGKIDCYLIIIKHRNWELCIKDLGKCYMLIIWWDEKWYTSTIILFSFYVSPNSNGGFTMVGTMTCIYRISHTHYTKRKFWNATSSYI